MAKGYIAGIGGGSGGGGGGGISPTLTDEEMVKWDDASGLLVGTGDINQVDNVNFGDKTLRCKDVTTEAGSINIGPSITVSSRGGDQQLYSNVNGDVSVSISSKIDDTGSAPPVYGERGPLVIKDLIQPDDSTPTNNVTLFTIASVNDKDFSEIYFNFINPVTNFRFIVISQETGEIVRYFPSQHQFEILEGVSVPIGEVKLTPEAVFSEKKGILFDYLVFGDSQVDMLGTGTVPWYAADTQLITDIPLVTEAGIAPESVSTSLINGGVITQNTPTTIDISAGSGRVVAIDGAGIATVTSVSWAAFTNITITNIATQIATRIAIDINGAIVQLPTDLTPEVARDYINLGIVSHATGVIGIIVNNSLKSQEVYSQLVDNFEVMGITRKKGLLVSPNSNLTFDKTSGELQAAGVGNDAGTRGQNIVRVAAETPTTFGTILGITDDLVASGQTSLDVGFYDSGTGTKTAIGAPSSQATIFYVYQSIADPAGVFVMYGQTVYSTLSEAVLNAATEVVQRPATVEQGANLIARFAVRSDATDLTDPAQAELLGGVKFGSGIEGNLSGSLSGGGDVLGPASSSVDEIPTYADASGKVLKAGSDISAIGGTLTRVAAASDIDFVDGANGTVTFTTGGVSVKNPSETPKYRLTDNIDQTIGGVELNGNLGTFTRLYRSLGEGVYKSELRMHDGHINLLQKTAINTPDAPKAFVQVGPTNVADDDVTDLVDSPAIFSPLGDNGGNTPLPPITCLTLMRRGVFGESYSNLARFDLSRYANPSSASRTQMDIRLSDGFLTNAGEGNNTPIVMTMRSDKSVSTYGSVTAKNTNDNTGFSIANDGGDVLGGVQWSTTGGGFTRLFRGNANDTFQSEIRLSNGYTNSIRKTAINTPDEPNGLLQVDEQPSFTVGNNTDTGTPLVVNDARDNGGDTPNSPTIIQQWRKAGIGAQAFGNIANITMGRYENVDTNSRTAVKLQLKHDTIIDNSITDVMEWRSSGEVSMPSTTAAFIPPQVTTAEMNAITPVGILINTDDGLLYIGNGVSWNPV